jgi:GntR family transcriptional regulator/MocR family aminotransferase
VAPPEISRRLGTLKLLTDSHSSLLVQAAVSEFLSRGHFETHLRKMRRECRLRLEALTAELHRIVVDQLSWIEPDAGTNLWCGVAPHLDAAAFCEHAIQDGLLITPATNYFADRQAGRRNLLLNFASVQPARARQVAELISASLKSFATDQRRRPAAASKAAAFAVESR